MRGPSFVTLVIVLNLVVFAGMAHATAPSKSGPEEVVGAMSEKLVRGVANVATGWLEFPKQIVTTFQEDGAVKGIFVGPLKGVGMTVLRTLTGAGEAATFYYPDPNYYGPYFDPAYVWDDILTE